MKELIIVRIDAQLLLCDIIGGREIKWICELCDLTPLSLSQVSGTVVAWPPPTSFTLA